MQKLAKTDLLGGTFMCASEKTSKFKKQKKKLWIIDMRKFLIEDDVKNE